MTNSVSLSLGHCFAKWTLITAILCFQHHDKMHTISVQMCISVFYKDK